MNLVGLASFLIVLSVSILVVRVASIALSLTGLSRESARFQARSAFTGTGFTTDESESVVNHPVRRRIIMGLMIARNAGIVTAASSLIISFVQADDVKQGLWTLVYLLIGVSALWGVTMSRWVERGMHVVIGWALKRFTTIEARDYAGLLHLSGNYSVTELQVNDGDWLADRTLADLRLADEGVLVLGIHRAKGEYLGTPTRDTKVLAGDTLILYGRSNILEDLDARGADFEGIRKHMHAKHEQERELEKQKEAESEENKND